MTQKDRDRMIELFAFYYFINDWIRDKETKIKLDTKKIGNINQNVKQLIIEYGKKEGQNAIEILTEECKKYDFVFLPKEQQNDKKELTTDTYELNILKAAIKKVIEKSTQCELCDKCDFKYCEWFTIQRFLNKEGKKTKKGCPFRKNLDDIFNIEDELGE